MNNPVQLLYTYQFVFKNFVFSTVSLLVFHTYSIVCRLSVHVCNCKLPEDGISVPKHVGVLLKTCMSCIVLCALIDGCADCKNMHCMNNTKYWTT